jgi:hypothetical protein
MCHPVSCHCLQVVQHNMQLVQHFTGAVVESVQHGMHPDASSQTAPLVPAAAGAGGGGVRLDGNANHSSTHTSSHSAAGLKQRPAARAQDGVQMTQLTSRDAAQASKVAAE